MKILFDQGTPVPLRRSLQGHQIDTAYELGWASLSNGERLATAENAWYELLLTTDQNLRYQQNLADRTIGILVLSSTSWPRIQRYVAQIQTAVDTLVSGTYLEIMIAM